MGWGWVGKVQEGGWGCSLFAVYNYVYLFSLLCTFLSLFIYCSIQLKSNGQ